MKKIYYSLILGTLCFSSVSKAQTTQTFIYTGSVESFTVPVCVSQITITAHGATGSNGNASTSPAGIGGLGAIVSGTYAVSSGDVLNIYVGGQGTLTLGGYNGGGVNAANSSAGGGGATDVRFNGTTLADRIIVAGGGGAGGNGGCFGATVSGGNGGPGGGDGVAGANSTAGGGGFPGVGTAFGSFGIGCGPFQGQAGSNGAAGIGGAGGLGTSLCTTAPTSGGSGGGGFIGGGGGGAGAAGTVGCSFNDTGAGGGGAGGDCYVDASMTSTSITPGGAALGNGMVTITYTINNSTGITQLAINELEADQVGATYQWVNCTTSQPILGEMSQTFTATEDGSYAVIVSLDGCDIQSACIDLAFVGIEENVSDFVTIYPNPTNGVFTVNVSNIQATSISVFNTLGEEIYQAKCNGNKTVVDLKNAANGVYFIQVVTDAGILNQRIVKQ
jgi:hypothetical protein